MAKGVYILVIDVKEDIAMRVGSLGLLSFPRGLYLYVGSGMGEGSASMEGRIERHLRRGKKLRWHIDYLLEDPHTEVRYVAKIEVKRKLKLECEVVKKLEKKSTQLNWLKGFGASDCKSKCFAHLLYFSNMSLDALLHQIGETLKDLESRILSLTIEKVI